MLRLLVKAAMQAQLFAQADRAPRDVRVRAHARRTQRGVVPVRQHTRAGSQQDLLSWHAPAPPSPKAKRGKSPASKYDPDRVLTPAQAAKLAAKARARGEALIARGEDRTGGGGRRNTLRQQRQAAATFEVGTAEIVLGSRYVKLAQLIEDGYRPTRFDELMLSQPGIMDAQRALHDEARRAKAGNDWAYRDRATLLWKVRDHSLTSQASVANEVARERAINDAIEEWRGRWPDLKTGHWGQWGTRDKGDESPEAVEDLRATIRRNFDDYGVNLTGSTRFDTLEGASSLHPGSLVAKAKSTIYTYNRRHWDEQGEAREHIAEAQRLMAPLLEKLEVDDNGEVELEIRPHVYDVVKAASALWKKSGQGYRNAAVGPEMRRRLELGWTQVGDRAKVAGRYQKWLELTNAEVEVKPQGPQPPDRSRNRDVFAMRLERAEKEEAERFIPYDLQRIPGYVETPYPWVERMIEAADLQPGDRVLEPSAGRGAIADRFPADVTIEVGEFDAQLRGVLQAKGYTNVHPDALTIEGRFDKIVMNPPWEKLQDVDHVTRALEANLADGGTLVAIVSSGAKHNMTRKAQDFRDMLEARYVHEWTRIPPEAWAKSGKAVNGYMLVIRKDAA